MSWYYGSKTVMLDGAPCVVASFIGELGHDREYYEATKPRTAFKAAYYKGGYRMLRDGIPVRMAAYVADWAPWMRRALLRGSETHKENLELKKQMKILFGK